MDAEENEISTRYKKRRQTILDAAAVEINENGLKGATLAGVAKTVGLKTHSVTYYFRRKEDLAAACFLQSINVYDDLISDAESESQPAQRLRRLISGYFRVLESIARGGHKDIVVFRDMRALADTGQADHVYQSYNAMFRRLRSLLFGHMKGPTVAAELSARAFLILSTLNGIRIWIPAVEPADYQRAAHYVQDFLAKGFASPNVSRWPPTRMDVSLTNTDDDIRDAFLRAASRVINEQGYKGASIDRISAALKMTKGAFYHYNATKDDVVARCFDRSFKTVRSVQDAGIALNSDGCGRLAAIAAALLDYQVSDQGPLLRITAISALPAELRPDVMDGIAKQAGRFANSLVDGMVDGSIRILDPWIAAYIVNNAINAAADLPRWVPDAKAADATSLFLRPLMFGNFEK